ncbi:hypothetical protein [Mucilaginibacter sp. SJ]|uniref:hypothetical protein n=1 Tax=Mucilaginibacter sp. SJ TaxID=3029053 RepID=UPI0023AA0659|nr:hypothetical protein [Mucilaginibacter sp. SJ]WEA00571.1 hypothetical protein MusilaSJ_24250 [Mucilaginibacter sp. SJ]
MKYIITILFLSCQLIDTADAQQFKVSYSPSAFNSQFTGNVILYISKKAAEPKNELYEPCYRQIVKSVKPGEAVVFDDKAIAHPAPLSKLERGIYYVQAVWDRDLGGRNIGTSPGNLYSKSVQISFNTDTTQIINLVCDQVVPQLVFVNSTYVKELKAPPKLLSSLAIDQ